MTKKDILGWIIYGVLYPLSGRRKMTTILGQAIYNLGKREGELTDMRHLLSQKCQNFDEFLIELENNKEISMKEKFYIIAITTLEWNQKYYSRL